jgi:hypothetical protein
MRLNSISDQFKFVYNLAETFRSELKPWNKSDLCNDVNFFSCFYSADIRAICIVYKGYQGSRVN